MKIHSIYDPSPQCPLSFEGTVSKTQQHFAEECDINHMLEQYNRTGKLPVKSGIPFFGDFSQNIDFHAAHNFLLEAQDAFMQLSAQVRARFKNDPGLLLDFLQIPENRDEAVKLGLIADTPQPPTPPPGSSTPPPAPPAAGTVGPSPT